MNRNDLSAEERLVLIVFGEQPDKLTTRPKPEEFYLEKRAELKTQLDEAMSSLTANQREVLTFRLGLYGNPRQTLQRIGKRLGFSKEWIRQIQKKAFRKMRHPTRVALLNKFIEGSEI